MGRDRPSRWCSARHNIRLRSLASWLLCLIFHSCRSANIAKTVLQTVGCASIKSREKMTHTFVSILIQSARMDALMVIIELNNSVFPHDWFDGYCSIAYCVCNCNNHVSLGNVAIKDSKPVRSSSDNVNSNSCSRRFFFIAFSQHESRAQR